MILSAQSIRRACTKPDTSDMMVYPFCERTEHRGLTFGLGPAGYDVRIAEEMVMRIGDFRLASTVERFNMPLNVLARVCDKSSLARRGLFVQNTVIEPGWRGHLTLELTMHGLTQISLRLGDPIAQILFELTDLPTEQPYAGKYQDQPAGPQPALMDGR